MEKGDFSLDGYVMGKHAPAYVSTVDWGVAGTRDQDMENPVGDNRTFGRDYLTGPTMLMSMATNGSTAVEAQDTLEDVTKAWRASRGLGQMSKLRYRGAKGERVVFGRPRNIFPQLDGYLIHQGFVVAIGEFAMRDPYYYSNDVFGKTLTLLATETGGFTTPIITPITTAQGGERQGIVHVGGNAETPLEIIIHGPISQPTVRGKGWRVELDISLEYDEWVTIDSAGSTSILKSTGASLAGKVSRQTRLTQAKLQPGTSEIDFGGVDPTGTATCKVSWRDAFTSF